MAKTIIISREFCCYCKREGKFEDQICQSCSEELDIYIPPVEDDIIEFEITAAKIQSLQVSENSYKFVIHIGFSFERWFGLYRYGFLSKKDISRIQKEFDCRGFNLLFYDGPFKDRTSNKITFLGIYISETQNIIKAITTFSEEI